MNTLQRVAELYPPNSLEKVYAMLRMLVLPLKELDDAVKGLEILDVGCGHGVVDAFLALRNPDRHILATDADVGKVMGAACLPLDNVDFVVKDLIVDEAKWYDTILLVDLLHHITSDDQSRVLRIARKRLKKDGVLVVKDVDRKPFYKLWYTSILDKVMRNGHQNYMGMEVVVNELVRDGYTIVDTVVCHRFLFPHFIVVASAAHN